MKRTLFFLAAFSYCSFAWSAISISHYGFVKTTPYIGGGFGSMIPYVSRNDYISPGIGWPNDRYVLNNLNNKPFLFLNAGYRMAKADISDWFPYLSLGLRYMYVRSTTLNGYIQQYSLPQFQNYTYRYKLQQQNLLVTLKSNIKNIHHFLPYILIGLGVSRNAVSGYSETPAPGIIPRVSPSFGSNINNNAAYTLGAGVDYLYKQIGFSLEADYNYLGYIATGKGANIPMETDTNYSGSNLSNRLTSVTVALGVNYYFP